MKKSLLAGFLCLAISSISIPVFAAEVRQSHASHECGSGYNCKDDDNDGICDYRHFTDEDRDGICDYFYDDNSDGNCDHCLYQETSDGSSHGSGCGRHSGHGRHHR